VTAAGSDSVYIYRDHLRGVGILPAFEVGRDDLESRLTPGRYVTPSVGQGAVLMNVHGMLCTLRILEVRAEVNSAGLYVQPHVRFSFVVHQDR